MAREDFLDKTFTAPQDRCRQTTELLLPYVDAQRSLRVLDLGCGTGRQLLDLAKALPNAHLTGIDIGEMNIQRATEYARAQPGQERLTFEVADYLHFEATPFDLIVSDSTLQNIDAPQATLFGKINSDLVAGGKLVATIPYTCAYNHILWSLRRAFRLLRNPLTDSILLAAAKVLHGRRYDEPSLRERIHYMYLLPHLYDCPALRRLLKASWGLDLVGEHDVPHESLAQPKHRMLILQKKADG